MSNNFYANFKLGDTRGFGSTITYRMHIGKATHSGAEIGYGISTFCGQHFPDVATWISFLRHNSDAIRIVDEANEEYDIEDFIVEYLENTAPTSDRQIQWLRDHEFDSLYMPLDPNAESTLHIYDAPQPDAWRARYWIDQATGKLFYSGEFS